MDSPTLRPSFLSTTTTSTTSLSTSLSYTSVLNTPSVLDTSPLSLVTPSPWVSTSSLVSTSTSSVLQSSLSHTSSLSLLSTTPSSVLLTSQLQAAQTSQEVTCVQCHASSSKYVGHHPTTAGQASKVVVVNPLTSLPDPLIDFLCLNCFLKLVATFKTNADRVFCQTCKTELSDIGSAKKTAEFFQLTDRTLQQKLETAQATSRKNVQGNEEHLRQIEQQTLESAKQAREHGLQCKAQELAVRLEAFKQTVLPSSVEPYALPKTGSQPKKKAKGTSQDKQDTPDKKTRGHTSKNTTPTLPDPAQPKQDPVGETKPSASSSPRRIWPIKLNTALLLAVAAAIVGIAIYMLKYRKR